MLPVALGTTINLDKAKVGDRLSGKLGQYVTVDGKRLARGTEVSGRIVEVEPSSAGTPARVTLVFDRIRIAERDVPMITSLRALASMQAVYDAGMPTNLIDDFGSTIRDWNTTQVGGQAVYRGDGVVMEGAEVVGKASSVGEVFGRPKTWPRSPCAGDHVDDTVQSFWVFSTDACGAYGLEGLKLAHAGRSHPAGEIVLEVPGKLQVRAGSGLLLVVTSSGQQPDAASDGHIAQSSDSIQVAIQQP